MTTDAILTTETNETQTPLKAPWRRFFARSLDHGLLATLLNLCLSILSPMKASSSSLAWSLLETYLCWLFLFLLEPLFLSKWGKTPGKWLFGLSVHQKDGSLLTRSQAFERLVKIFRTGEGYAIPFYSLYRNYKCYEIYTEEDTLPWDHDLCYEVKPFRLRSAFAYIGIALFTTILTVLVNTWNILPNGGSLTVAEFIENYNRISEYAEQDTLSSLTKDGKWKTDENAPPLLLFSPNAVFSDPVIREENGTLSSFSYTITDTEGDILSPSEQNPLLTMALLRTQVDFLHPDLERIGGQLLSSEDTQEPQQISSVLTYMEQHPYCSYTIETGNLRIIQEVELIGYDSFDKHDNNYLPADDLLADEDATETYYSTTFTLEQN